MIIEISNKELTPKELILSFSVFGVVALIAILIWKRSSFLEFLGLIFNPSNILSNAVIGVFSGLLMAILATVLVKVTKTKIPDGYNEELNNLMKMSSGPILVGILPGIFEELLFRGFLLPFAIQYTGTIAGVIISTLIFWGVHIPQYKWNIVLNLNVILLSVITSILFIKTETIWASIFAHSVYNYLVALAVQQNIIKL